MEIVPGLFGDWGLVREWGRIGRGSQTRTDWFGTETEAQNARIELHTERAKRSYV
ncbi:MAG: WGR domain-containing protein [Rhodobacteraceae bacterium]|nr:WGR domain-containing protein [Paracoccaceae bacterium]